MRDYIDKIIDVVAVLVCIGGVIAAIPFISRGNHYDSDYYFVALLIFVSTLVISLFMIGFSVLIENTREIAENTLSKNHDNTNENN